MEEKLHPLFDLFSLLMGECEPQVLDIYTVSLGVNTHSHTHTHTHTHNDFLSALGTNKWARQLTFIGTERETLLKEDKELKAESQSKKKYFHSGAKKVTEVSNRSLTRLKTRLTESRWNICPMSSTQ